MVGQIIQYKVVVPGFAADDLLGVLNSLGAQGWELVDVEVQANFLIFKKASLPAGCLVAAAIVIKRVLDSLRGR